MATAAGAGTTTSSSSSSSSSSSAGSTATRRGGCGADDPCCNVPLVGASDGDTVPCHVDEAHRPEAYLTRLARGELRWPGDGG